MLCDFVELRTKVNDPDDELEGESLLDDKWENIDFHDLNEWVFLDFEVRGMGFKGVRGILVVEYDNLTLGIC